MPGTRDKEKSGGGSFYAWSDLHYGGESEKREASGNRYVNVVTSRNVLKRGEKVSQSDIDVSDEEWEALVESGSIRQYPLPEGADEYTSPHKAVMDTLVGPDGEIDVNKVMQLQNMDVIATSPPATNPPAEEGKELPAGT